MKPCRIYQVIQGRPYDHYERMYLLDKAGRPRWCCCRDCESARGHWLARQQRAPKGALTLCSGGELSLVDNAGGLTLVK